MPTTLGRAASDEAARCSVVAALGVIGDFWTLAVVRCAFLGLSRFGAIRDELDVASNLLSERLGRLVEAGVLERRRYCDRPPRDEYVLTPAGRQLAPVILALQQWGERHARQGPPGPGLRHACGGRFEVRAICGSCGEPLAADG